MQICLTCIIMTKLFYVLGTECGKETGLGTEHIQSCFTKEEKLGTLIKTSMVEGTSASLSVNLSS